MYQIRWVDGSTEEFKKFSELLEAVRLGADSDLEKISFNGPDGTRLRFVNCGDSRFALTFWSGFVYERLQE